jgi:hypothetical protein
VSNLSTSKRTLMALRDECDRLCLVARRHDERLRDVAQALEAARDVNGSSAEAVRFAERALHSGSQVQEMAQTLLARLEAEAAERTHAGAHPITAVLVVDDIEDARVLIVETLLHAARCCSRGSIAARTRESLTRLFDADDESPNGLTKDLVNTAGQP